MKKLLIPGVVAALLFALSPATAQERPLIWNFTRSGESAFGARLGAHFHAPWKSSAGVDIAMGGQRIFDRQPVTAWGAVELPGVENSARKRRTELRVTARGENGPRTATATHSVRTMLPGMDAEFDQTVTVRSLPGEDAHPTLRSTQTLKLTASRSRTMVTATTTASTVERRKTTVSIEQPVRDALKLRAAMEDAATRQRKGRFSATYSFKW